MSDFDFSSYKVLLCDTDPEVIDVARETYLDANIGDFIATPSPDAALKHVPVMKPDLILVALKFPDISGVEVIQKIRSLNDGEFYKTPILMLLQKVSQNLLREICRAGIEGALRKPLTPEKMLRFSRAVILKPRRFICVRQYFGPERRYRDDPHLSNKSRSSDFSKQETSTDEFTRSRPERPLEPGQSKLGGGTLAAGGSLDIDAGHNNTSKNKDFDLSKGTEAQTKKPQRDYDLSDAQTESKTPSSNDYDLTDAPAKKKKKPKIDETSALVETPVKTDDKIDTKPRKAAKESKEKPSTKPKEKTVVIEPKEPIAETGPKDDDFEEIIDLEECLELHKLWINSGGKSGQQAKRPHSNFDGKELEDADFTRAILPRSNFEGVNCVKTVFRKADLSGSTFKGALLSSADLRVSLLRKADMRDARMEKANLLGADLAGANLAGANLRGVNLSGANLTRTNLCGVNLLSVQGLIPEQLNRAITDQSTQVPLNARKP